MNHVDNDDLQEKNDGFDGLMIAEKKARKKLENERAEQEFELEKLRENAQKTMIKVETLVCGILIEQITIKNINMFS